LFPGHLIKQIQIVLSGKYRHFTDCGDDQLNVRLLDSEIDHTIAEKINSFAKIHGRGLNVKATVVTLLAPENAWL
jgi:hypothetical protein